MQSNDFILPLSSSFRFSLGKKEREREDRSPLHVSICFTLIDRGIDSSILGTRSVENSGTWHVKYGKRATWQRPPSRRGPVFFSFSTFLLFSPPNPSLASFTRVSGVAKRIPPADIFPPHATPLLATARGLSRAISSSIHRRCTFVDRTNRFSHVRRWNVIDRGRPRRRLLLVFIHESFCDVRLERGEKQVGLHAVTFHFTRESFAMVDNVYMYRSMVVVVFFVAFNYK